MAHTEAPARIAETALADSPDSAWDARTVLVHDYLHQHGGAERVLEVMHELATAAPFQSWGSRSAKK